jgi:hypothetical protein
MGRHSHPDDLESPELDPIEAARTAAAIRKSAQLAHASATAGRSAKTSPVADLQLVLHDRRLLRVCLVAAIAPFVVYFAVVIGLHQMRVWAIFLGAPLVLAGILIGGVLDRAYAQRARAAEAPQSAARDQPPAQRDHAAAAAIGPSSAVPAKLG